MWSQQMQPGFTLLLRLTSSEVVVTQESGQYQTNVVHQRNLPFSLTLCAQDSPGVDAYGMLSYWDWASL